MDSFFSAGNEYDIFTLVSNFALLLPATEAVVQFTTGRHRLYLVFVAVVFYVETIVSLLYHLCKSYDVCVGFGFYTWHEFDHFFATSMIWLAVVLLLHGSQVAKLVLAMLGMLVVGIILGVAAHANASPGTAISVFAAVAMGGFLLYLAWYRRPRVGRSKKMLTFFFRYAWVQHLRTGSARLPPYHWPELLLGTLLLTYATTLFTIQNYWPEGYWATHAIWHCMAGVGWTYLLLATRDPIESAAGGEGQKYK